MKPLLKPIAQASARPRVIAVDDDRVMLTIIEQYLIDRGFDVLAFLDANAALDAMAGAPHDVDVILLDRIMPGMDGIHMVKRLKKHPVLAEVPVVMLTGSNRPGEVREGIDAGVFYYLTKPVEEHILESVLTAALRETEVKRRLTRELGRHEVSFQLLRSAQFAFRTLEDAESLATFVAQCFPSPERVVTGLAELFINAVEHGHLGIGYDEKTELLHRGNWREEINARLNLPQFSGLIAEVLLQKRDDGIYARVTDQGKGFDWRSYLHIDPARASDNHGRGIAQANALCFDKMAYNAAGNQVTVAIMHAAAESREIDW